MSKKNIFFNNELLILSILKRRDCYGYEITKIIEKESEGLMNYKVSSLYPVLHSLIDQKYITSKDEIVNNKVRVYYHLEPSGQKYLEEITSNFKKSFDIIMQIIEKEK